MSDPTTNDQNDNPDEPSSPFPDDPSSKSKFKLRKIPPIPIRRSNTEDIMEILVESDIGYEADAYDELGHDVSSSLLHASALGLNHIRTRTGLAASSAPSRSRFSSANFSPLNPIKESKKNKEKDGNIERPKYALARELGRKCQLAHAKSLKTPPKPDYQSVHAFDPSKEIHSPRFQAILRVTSGRKRRSDIKSFSHELNSKGVKPYPFWKSRALAHPEEIMAVIREKFDRLKEEVNSDLGVFAGDLVGILEKNSETHPEWRKTLEDLLVIARHCALMSANEFWNKCEGIVQNLDDRRQELHMGILKQAHTRILFILTRCTRLLQFQKEGLFEDEHILGLHQLSDLGVYPLKGSFGLEMSEDTKKHDVLEQTSSNLSQVHDSSGAEPADTGTAKSTDSSRDRISSWKKLPPPAEKSRKKGQDESDTPKVQLDALQLDGKPESFIIEKIENLGVPECPPESSEVPPVTKRVTWGTWNDQQHDTDGDSMICRICEVQIPTVHVEDHSKICTIADRCDLKGLNVNERLQRISETLEKIVGACTPKGSDTSVGSPEVARVSHSCFTEEFDVQSPKENSLSRGGSEDMVDCVPESENCFIMDDLSVSIHMPLNTHSILIPDQGIATPSAGSSTPRSPLLTPRTSQIELLLGGSNSISELENFQQIHRLMDIARSVASTNTSDYSTLEYFVDRLEDLNNTVQDRKVDALIVETFGRRIEKLIQEKYVHHCGQIDDEKLDSSMADEDSSVEEDTIRSLRTSPLNTNGKDRTSIEDFEILKPISRGAFGRVFLAKKRATGDLFAIKVLKKADMIRKNAVESILAERNILISVRNPFVVRFFYSFTCRENLYLVMEYLNGGDLYSLLRNLGCLDEDMARVYIAEVVLALEYLHSLNVIHRDLKPDNLLIAHNGHIKLTDFGLSKVGLINSTDDLSVPAVSSTALGDDEPKSQHTIKREQRQKQSAVGTPDYLAPEILLGMGHGATADWWSVGVILFELLVGIPPFNADHPQKIFDNIMNRDIPWPHIPEEMSYEAFDLIDKLLIENPVQRLGATGAREVKTHVFFKDINWDTLARQKAAFIPSAECAYDTSYFTSRYIWNADEGHLCAVASDFDEMTDSGSVSCGSSYTTQQDEEGDECGTLADFGGPNLTVKYSFSNFSFKNLSQLASINYDLVIKGSKESTEDNAHS